MDQQEKILSFLRMRGPSLPVNVAKHMDTTILMASAMLADLSSKGKLIVSKLKVGGSPLYLLRGQEAKLQNFCDSLNQKERRAFELLKEKKILRESKLDPLTRVCLKQLGDFATPLEVTLDGNAEIFWKWNSIDNSQAEGLIKQILNIGKQEKKVLKKEVPKTVLKEEVESVTKEKVKSSVKKPKKQEKKKALVDTTISFHEKIISFFKNNGIRIVGSECLKKGKEYDFIIKLSSAVGELDYYCKAKSKKRVSDADLSTAYVQGQIRKTPGRKNNNFQWKKNKP